MTERKIHAMHKKFGTCGGFLCKNCCHLISGVYHDKRYHKCELYGLSHSEATDWRLSNCACAMFDVEVDMKNWVPVLDLIRGPVKQEGQLPGQIEMEMV